jgi:hydroxymethylpyrimidine/phosphomethylpyrimidine kinase
MTPIALTIAGSDSGGGAGIQADLKTFAALGVYGTSAITALTAQNTRGVAAIHPVPAEFVKAQIEAVFSDFRVGAVKIGMLCNAEIIAAVAAALDKRHAINVVLDPVMVASSGERLLTADAVEALKRELIRLTRVVTPNLPEAAALLDMAVATDEHKMRHQAACILARDAQAVLIKGGHGSGAESVDIMVDRGRDWYRFAAPRIAARNTHGTGCTLSAAIAAGLAKGQSLEAAVRAAKDFVTAAIAAADRLEVGEGRGPLNHFHAWWKDAPIGGEHGET